MPPSHGGKRWSDLAEEAHRLADDMRDAETKRIMNGIAADYEAFAHYAQQIADARRRLHAANPYTGPIGARPAGKPLTAKPPPL